jgi:enamine deaminase RidA (YjgF/YER057c/UK114 family)
VTAYGNGDILHAPIVRAGNWIFGTGLRATTAHGLMDPSALKKGRPLDAPPKAQREAQIIFERLKAQLSEAGGSIARVARLDQYYTDALSVDPYHVVRKQALSGQVAPSTSIIVSRLLNLDAAMDVQVLAPTEASNYAIERVAQTNLNAPQTSGYAPCLRVGKMVFVAGQLARDASGNIAAEAMLPPGQQWNGTRIKLETDYLIEKRLIPALDAAGSSLDLVLKAQVYLAHETDFPAFWQSWSRAFGARVPPTTVVPVRQPAFGTREATIEINLVAAHQSARSAVRDIECDVALIGSDMLPARVFDNVLFVAGLMAIDEEGLVPAARCEPSAPFYYSSVRAQMADILAKARRIFEAAGTDLPHVVRALQFHANLSEFHGTFDEWRKAVGNHGIPFSAVEVAPGLFVPGAALIVDLWGYAPNAGRGK